MEQAVLKTLEYDKIIAMLAARAESALGKELAKRLLPSGTFGEVGALLSETAEGRAVMETGGSAPLGGIRDIRAPLQKTRLGAVLEPHELLEIASTLYAMRRIKRFFKELELDAPILSEAAARIELLGQLERRIETIVDEHGNIRDDASAELARLRREIKQSQSRIKERLDSVLRSAEYQKYFQDVLVTMRGDRYVVPIKQEYRQFFPGIVHDQSSSGATLFIEPMAVVNLNNDVKQCIAAEKHELERILRSISQQIADQSQILQENCSILARLDFVFAKAKLAGDMDASMPLLSKDGHVELNQARHPLLDANRVVPISLSLGDRFRTLLITGPNTGGKTVGIKTLGLLALMNQSGLFIPALSGSKLPVFRQVFADIGDEQSIEQSLSTFSAHMTHLVKILGEATDEDLLLIDEIGAGTDPEEGAALAMAILEHLMNVGARVVATTHYSELKTFAYAKEGIENASVEFDIKTLRPTYRLLIGIPGTSNAFAISKRLGLADELIARARQLIDADHAQFERILNHLETEKILYEQRNADIAQRQRQIEALERKVNAMRAELSEKKESILRKAREDSANLLRGTRREAEEIIAKLKEQFNDQGAKNRQAAIDEARGRMKTAMSAAAFSSAPKPRAGKPVRADQLSPGDAVYITTLDQKGTVISCSPKDVFVQLGAMKTTVPLSACLSADPERNSRRESPASKPMNLSKTTSVRRQVDLRGMMVDEAESVVGKYLDDAILAGLSEVLVIHGKGTGALRKGIRSYLKSHRSVQDISIGELGEGGDGATVVKLR